MNSKGNFIFISLIIIASVFFIAMNTDFSQVYIPEAPVSAVKHVKLAGVTLKVELANTPEKTEKGLSGRESLAEDEAMLFVFDIPGKHAFWMPDMKFPIDIIWLSTDLKVVYIKKDAQPSSYPEAFEPTADAKYVLETVAGFSEKNKLKEGDNVEFVFE